eukprot:6207571-Pleurochrysis_carterae.AAC.6
MASPARRPSVILSPTHSPPEAPARAGRKTWLARRVIGGLRAPRGVGRSREAAAHGRTVGAARCTEADGSTRKRASRTPGA